MQPSLGCIIAIVGVVVLLVVSGIASGSEIAFFSMSPSDLSQLDEDKNLVDRTIRQLRDDSERTLATILILNNLVNVTIIILCNYIFGQLISFGDAVWLEFLVITVLLTFLLLLFGEIMPKVYCRENALSFCRLMARPLVFSRRLFWPLESLMMSTGFLAAKVVHNHSHVLSVDELGQALELTDKEEIKEEESILQGIIRFGDETAREVMTSRQDVVDLEIHSSFSDVLKCVLDNNYSRIPVYQGTQDNIKGILYIKDLLPHLSKPATFRWQSLVRPPYFVPETKKIDDLLRDFQENKVHIAVVVDEFGGTSGIVTLEDILEEIFGEINDEFDEEQKSYTRLNSNTYLFEGKTLVSELAEITGVQEEVLDKAAGESDTIAGLILEMKGDFPAVHETFNVANLTLEIMKIEERRISTVKIVVHNA